MFNPSAFENAGPDGHGALEFGPAPGVRAGFVPLRETRLTGEAAGPLATLALTQVFRLDPAFGPAAIECVYRFPLPGDAAVMGVSVRFGAVVIEARLAARAAAEQDYAEARAAGRQAALVTREAPEAFTLQVSGVHAGEDVAIETRFVVLARPEGPGWALRVPLTTPPRYSRGDEGGTPAADAGPFGAPRDPGHRAALDLVLRGAAGATATLPLETSAVGEDLRVRLAGGSVLPDRDLVLAWRPATAPDRPTLSLLRHDDAASGHAYFLAQVAPPAMARARVPREVVLLVDHSGSMQGAKWRAADWAVELFLRDLGPEDAFALATFHDAASWFRPAPVAALPAEVDAAIAFLKAETSDGGTELGVALEQALALPRGAAGRARHVLVVTDAQVTDEGRLLRLVEAEAARPERRRVSLLCVDAAPNDFLARELAEVGGGVARFLTSDPEAEDVTTALEALLADWAAPVWTGLRLTVDAPAVEGAGRRAWPAGATGSGCRVSATGMGGPGGAAGAGGPGDADGAAAAAALDLGDLPAGRAAWACGRVPGGAGRALRFEVLAQGGTPLTGRVAPAAAGADGTAGAPVGVDAGPGLRALFGARRVMGLEHLMASYREGEALAAALARLGYPAEAAAIATGGAVYAENARKAANEVLEPLLVREALAYGLASTATAFVATRAEAGRPIAATVAVASARPAGWAEGGAYGGGGMGAVPGGPPAFGLAAPAPMVQGLVMMDLGGFDAGADDEDEALADALYAAPPPGAAAPRPRRPSPLFTGVPAFVGGEAVLYEGTMDRDLTLSALVLDFPDGAPAALDPGLVLALYVDDLATPRARVRLADMVRLGGERPLNVRVAKGARLRVTLSDPAGAWAAGAPALAVRLG